MTIGNNKSVKHVRATNAIDATKNRDRPIHDAVPSHITTKVTYQGIRIYNVCFRSACLVVVYYNALNIGLPATTDRIASLRLL